MDFERHKKHNEQASADRDIISALPDNVLSHILSFLNTTDAFKTCILSRRWKNVWTSVSNLEFYDDRVFKVGGVTKRCEFRPKWFVIFVERVLSFYQSKNIQSLYLHCCHVDSRRLVSSWIRSAVNCGVRKLDLNIDIASKGKPNVRVKLFKLPRSLLTCKTLVELRLHSNFTLCVPKGVCFPVLKILYMRLECPNVNQIHTLFGMCPLLEELSVDWSHSNGYNANKMFKIVVPTLKRLSLSIHKYHKLFKPTFVVRAPNLEYLNIRDDSSAWYVVNEKPILNEAFVDLEGRVSECVADMDKSIRAMELFRGINYTKFLSLSLSTMADLGSNFNDRLPTFPNLIQLELKLGDDDVCQRLPHFLNNLPNLEVLILNMGCFELDDHEYRSEEECLINNSDRDDSYYEDSDGYDSESDDVDSDGDESEPDNVESDEDESEPGYVYSAGNKPYTPNFVRNELDSLPSLLAAHLKVIKIDTRVWSSDNLELAKYLLKNSKVLEKFRLVISYDGDKERLKKGILKSPKGSKTCKVEFL